MVAALGKGDFGSFDKINRVRREDKEAQGQGDHVPQDKHKIVITVGDDGIV